MPSEEKVWEKIEALANERVAKSAGDLTQEEAISEVLKSDAGRALYGLYMASRGQF